MDPVVTTHRPDPLPATDVQPFSYSVYGLHVGSPWPLPCRSEMAPGSDDVVLFDGAPKLFSDAALEAERCTPVADWFHYCRLEDGSHFVRWSGLFEFVIAAGGRRIACRSLEHASPEALHTYLLGQVLSFALLEHGIEPLHATAAVVNGQAVAFTGECGYGKSSLGAAFLQAGHPLLTDDLLVPVTRDGSMFAQAGMPRIKLFPEVAEQFLGKQVRGTPMNPRTRKLVIPLDALQAYSCAAPLAAIYVLGAPARQSGGSRITIRRLSRRGAFIALLRNTFNRVVTEPERLKRQFVWAGHLASSVRMKSLSYPRAFESMPTLREAILADLRV